MSGPTTFAQRLDTRIAEALDKRLVEQVGSGSGRRLAHLVAVLLATPVHLLSVVLLGCGVALVVWGDGWWHWLLAVLLLALAWFTRPQIHGAAAPGSQLVDAEQSPELTALVTEVATVIGARPPREVRVVGDFNAYVGQRGFGGHQLVIGAPLWIALSPQARIGLLGHELGHVAHGDLLNSQYVGGAYRTLAHWVALFDPAGTDIYRGQTPLHVRALMAPPRWLLTGYLRLLLKVNATAQRRRELCADVAAALAAGTGGAVACLEALLALDALSVAANRAAIDASRPDLGAAIVARMAEYDAEQRAGTRKRAASDRRSVDATHPPTTDRLRLLESIEPSAAAIVLDQGRSRQIDRELALPFETAFRRLGDTYR